MQAALRDKLLQDHSVLAAFLTGLRMYLEDPTKVQHALSASALFMHCHALLLHTVFCTLLMLLFQLFRADHVYRSDKDQWVLSVGLKAC